MKKQKGLRDVKNNLDAELYESDIELEAGVQGSIFFSWRRFFNGVMPKMDKLSWLISDLSTQCAKLENLLYQDAEERSILHGDIYQGWLKIFEICKFWLHNFD